MSKVKKPNKEGSNVSFKPFELKKNASPTRSPPQERQKQEKKGMAGDDPLRDFTKMKPMERLAHSPYKTGKPFNSTSNPVSRASSIKSQTETKGSRTSKSPLPPKDRIAVLEQEMQDAQANKDWQGSTQLCIELLALAQLAYGTESILEKEDEDEVASDNYQLAKAQWNLANCYLQQRLVNQAVEHANRAADILAMGDAPDAKDRKKAGQKDQDRRSLQAAVLITLAIGYTLGRKYKEAHSSLALALEVGPEPVPIYKAIAKVFLAEQKDDEALEALETALQLQVTYGGQDHIQIAEISKEMGRLSLAKGDAEGSFQYYTRAYTHYSNVAPNSFEAAECGLQIGAARAKAGDYKAAEPLLQVAQEAYDEHVGPLHPTTLHVVRERALLLVHDKRYKEALSCLQSLASRQNKAFGPKTIKLAETTKLMGTVHAAMGDNDGALFMYSEAAQRYEKKYGKKHKKVKELLSIVKKIKTKIGDKNDDDSSEEESEESESESESEEESDQESEGRSEGSDGAASSATGRTENENESASGRDNGEESSEYAEDNFEDDEEET